MLLFRCSVGRIPNTRTDPYYQLLLDEVLGPQLVVNLDGRDNRSRMDADDSTRLGKKRFRDDTSGTY